jgi:hypothetical protein
MSNDQTIAVHTILAYPFVVIDAALSEFFLTRPPNGTHWRWEQRASGASVHHITKDDTEIYHIVVRARSANKTSLTLGAVAASIAPPGEQTEQFAKSILGQFAAWLSQDQTALQHLSPPEPPNQATALARRRRESHAEDDWAWEEVNLRGRTSNEIRAEWEQRAAHRALSDPARSFRHAINPKRRIKRGNIPPS